MTREDLIRGKAFAYTGNEKVMGEGVFNYGDKKLYTLHGDIFSECFTYKSADFFTLYKSGHGAIRVFFDECKLI